MNAKLKFSVLFSFPYKTTKRRYPFIEMSKNKNNKIECPVCRAAGKSDIGHYLRNARGNVVCPTLLEQSCRHCGQKGHTPKYCVAKKNEEKDHRRVVYRSSYETQTQVRDVSSTNPFQAFDDEELEEGEIRYEEEEEKKVTTKTREELRIMLCELLGMNKKLVTTPAKRRMLWSEMEDSDDEE